VRPLALVAAGWLAASCASPSAGNGAAAGAPSAQPSTSVPAPSGPTGPGTGAALAAALQGSTPDALTPPTEAGASRSTVSGCLTAANESDATRFPAPAVSRNPAPPVTVTAVPGGALVVHELTHACCLRSQVKTSLSGSRAVVRETLTGSPCRCMCGSTLRTAVALPAGAWTVAVELETGGEVRLVAELPVAVR
jgi:hypothetical protein